MVTVRPARERGHFDHGWLDTRHTFSFGDYHDPAHMGFGPLRAINEDVVAPGAGFARHLHHDMEIVTWVLEGELEHQDSLGHTSVIRRGLLQRMTAGTGIEHSEVNASQKLPVRLMQIWMRPDRPGHRPEYEQRHLPLPERRNKLRLAVSGDGADGSLRWHQDARLWVAEISADVTLEHVVAPGRRVWIHVTGGRVAVNAVGLVAGDGAAIEDVSRIDLAADGECALLLFDLP
jgi:redox-sensitive bicupin YhaK (pirin superfamily)